LRSNPGFGGKMLLNNANFLFGDIEMKQLKQGVKMRKKLFIVLFAVCISEVAIAEEEPVLWFTTAELGEYWNSRPAVFDKQTVAYLQAKLRESRAVWEKNKGKYQNSYTYTRAFSSWVGFGHKTAVRVKNGVVVERHFEAFNRDNKITESYTEGPKDIGTHKRGKPVSTMEELYEECANAHLKQDPKTNVLSLRISQDGILEGCTYRSIGCADDCTRGLQEFRFAWENSASRQQYPVPFEGKNN